VLFFNAFVSIYILLAMYLRLSGEHMRVRESFMVSQDYHESSLLYALELTINYVE